jgi:hypothetical protein
LKNERDLLNSFIHSHQHEVAPEIPARVVLEMYADVGHAFLPKMTNSPE